MTAETGRHSLPDTEHEHADGTESAAPSSGAWVPQRWSATTVIPQQWRPDATLTADASAEAAPDLVESYDVADVADVPAPAAITDEHEEREADPEPVEPAYAAATAVGQAAQSAEDWLPPLGWQYVGGHWFAADSIFTGEPASIVDGSGAPQLEDYLDARHEQPDPGRRRGFGRRSGPYSAGQLALLASGRERRERERQEYYRSLLPRDKNAFEKIVATTIAGDGGIGKSTLATNCVAVEQRELRHIGNVSLIFDGDTSRGVVHGRLNVKRDKDWLWLADNLGDSPTLDEILKHFSTSRDGVIIIPKYTGKRVSRSDQARQYIKAYGKCLPHATSIWHDCGSTLEHELPYAILAHTQVPFIVTRPRLFRQDEEEMSEGLERLQYAMESLQDPAIPGPPVTNAVIVVNNYRGEALDDLYERYHGVAAAITTLRYDPTLKQDDSHVDPGALARPVLSDILRVLALKFLVGREYVRSGHSAAAIARAVATMEADEPQP
jgi:MinD-like ATPase involved in chromosome partitioning or flagellar assembly